MSARLRCPDCGWRRTFRRPRAARRAALRHRCPPEPMAVAPSSGFDSPLLVQSWTPVIGSMCTGGGGLDLGVLTALGGGRVAWCADPDPHIAQILAARLPEVPNLGDIRTVDWTSVEPVDVVTAGFPCQDISAAGSRAGIEKGTRSGLWAHVVDAVRVLRPAFVVVENVAALRWRNGGLHRVLGDLADSRYDTLWRSVRASDIGAPHRRERVFVLAWPSAAGVADAAGSRRRRVVDPGAAVANSNSRRCQELHPPHPGWRLVPTGPSCSAALKVSTWG